MPIGQQRAVFVNGTNSYLMEGDAERDHDRFFVLRDAKRNGCALAVLLEEGWIVAHSVALPRVANGEDNYGCAIIILERPPM